MEKYKELYNLAFETYKEQHKRYDILFDKATKYFTVITLLIGLYGYLGKAVLNNLMENPYRGYNEWATIFLGFCSLALLIASWSYLFRVLRLEVLFVIPLNEEVLNFYNNNTLIDIYYTMTKGFKENIEKNDVIINYKSNLLTHAYLYMKYFTIIFAFFSLSYLLLKWHQIFY